MFDHIIYNPDTGILTTKITRGNVKAGGILGYTEPIGYVQVRVSGKTYLAHRLAWFLYCGYWPKPLDHVNGNRSDNRISNLRECDSRQNMLNRDSDSGSSSKFKGVTFVKNRSRWQASIDKKYIGYFRCEHEAALVYNHHAEVNHGEFVRFNQVFFDFEVDCDCDM